MNGRSLSVIFVASLILSVLFRDDRLMLIAAGALTGVLVTAIAMKMDRDLWELPSSARTIALRDGIIAAFAMALFAAVLIYWKVSVNAAVAGSAGFIAAGVTTLIVAAMARRRAPA